MTSKHTTRALCSLIVAAIVVAYGVSFVQLVSLPV